MKIVYAFFMAAMIASSARGDDIPPDQSIITLQGSANFGPISGYLQTPAGGQPGTSSKHRPTLEELGIDEVWFYDTRLDLQWHSLRLYGGYQFLRLDGSATLAQPLISHGVSFAAGDGVTSHNQLDWARMGAGWKFDFLDQRLEIVPQVEFALFDFKYSLSDPLRSVTRDYVKGSARLGLETVYHLTPFVSLSLNGGGALPLANMPQIASVSAAANFRLSPRSWRVKPKLFIGGGMEWIDYEDSQRLPNHIKADIGPFFTGGLGFAF